MSVRAGIAALVVVVAALLATARLAAAHPLGLPAFATLSPNEDRVTLSWVAAADDIAALARSIGFGGNGPLTREQDAELATSPAFRDRVLRDVGVRQAGVDCDEVFEPQTGVVVGGFTVTFQCPETVSRIRVRIALLHDIDSRYRTLASGTGPSKAARNMYTVAEPEHDVLLDPTKALDPQEGMGRRDVGGAFGGALPLERRFVAAIDSTPGTFGLLLALLIAFGVGALHALAPGHGKAVAAGYLIGDRARLRHAVVLGVTVALMHTGSVLVLGLALYQVHQAPDAVRLSAAIGLVTGLIFTVLGTGLLVNRWRSRVGSHDHHEHAHSPSPMSVQGVVVLGAAGGLLPSPSAMLVLLTALAVGRVSYGLSLIAAFSAGLAMTVTLVGVAVIKGRDVLHSKAGERYHRWVHAAPLLGAAGVTALGATIAITAALKL